MLHAFSTFPAGPAISSACQWVEKPHLAFTSAACRVVTAGKLQSRVELLLCCCCWTCFIAAVMKVLGSLQKSMQITSRESKELRESLTARSAPEWLFAAGSSGQGIPHPAARSAAQFAFRAALAAPYMSVYVIA